MHTHCKITVNIPTTVYDITITIPQILQKVDLNKQIQIICLGKPDTQIQPLDIEVTNVD